MYSISYNQFTNQTNHIFPLFTTEIALRTLWRKRLEWSLHSRHFLQSLTLSWDEALAYCKLRRLSWMTTLKASKRASTACSPSVYTLTVKLFHGFTLNLALWSSCLFGNLINSTSRSQHRQLRGRLMSSKAKFVMSLLSRHKIQIKLLPHRDCINSKQGECAALCGNDYKHV